MSNEAPKIIPRWEWRTFGESFGEAGGIPEQARLGDFWIPQRGLFAIGRAFFEPPSISVR